MLADLRSDFIGRPTPRMIEAMNGAAQTPFSFGLRESPTQRRLEELAAGILDKEDALFFPTCSMCNQTAINIFCRPGDGFIAEASSHCILSEGGAPAMLSGAMPVGVPGENGIVPISELDRVFCPGDEQRPRTGLLVLENTHNRSGGAVLDEAVMEGFAEYARARKIPVHLDGARIFNAAAALGVPADRLTRHVDSVSISLNKGLSAPMGAILAGEKRMIEEAVRVRQRFGGGWRPTDIPAAAGIVALEDMIHRLADDHARAQRLARGIADCSCIDVDIESVRTNLVVAGLNHPSLGLTEFVRLLADHGVLVLPFGRGKIRMAIYWEIDDQKVERVIDVFHRLDAA